MPPENWNIAAVITTALSWEIASKLKLCRVLPCMLRKKARVERAMSASTWTDAPEGGSPPRRGGCRPGGRFHQQPGHEGCSRLWCGTVRDMGVIAGDAGRRVHLTGWS
jgi:hypothetical protein